MTVFTNTSNRPWGVVQDDYANSGIADAEGNWVIEPSAVTPEDADLIVRAVNAHDALMAALEQAEAALGVILLDENIKAWMAVNDPMAQQQAQRAFAALEAAK